MSKVNKRRFTLCDRCHRERHTFSVCDCKHPAVNEVYGHHVCTYCCQRCKFHIKYTVQEHGASATKCGYSEA